MDQMGHWFKLNSLNTSEQQFFKAMNASNNQLKDKLNLDGFSYHTYSFLEKSVGLFYVY